MTAGERPPDDGTRAARVAPGRRRDVGPLVAGLARVFGRVAGTEPPAVFLTLGRHRRLFWGWLHFAGRLMPGGRLRRRETELVVLRVAAWTGSDYELTQHRRLGRRAGLTAEEVARAEAGTLEGWSPREHALLAAAGELLDREDLSEEGWQRLRASLDEREAIEAVLLVGHYRMLATALRALRVRPDRPR
ncbi:carboxymuconolactone decarboxylase family protein [Nocardioides sp. TF02-7]|uniref:carboxymuconolactone decarboxylase family protein n=1 Tax=Nocardioides sp. TF02-7 TaxID=2917724 RepID=UPI001F06BB24|nr:carboxymuconolactone decarboxylase family protein [Nocardioides sp. TF02-7]UMG92303.1 carboxymuconolactone decarboxylase family protein [Nocardioides sp. TF02-7]